MFYLNHKSASVKFTWCHWRSILIRYYLLSDIYQIPKLCIRLQVTMGCCKFIFVYTTRTIITVSPEINIIFKKTHLKSHIPKWYLEKICTLFLSGFSQDLFLYLKGVSYFMDKIHKIFNLMCNFFPCINNISSGRNTELKFPNLVEFYQEEN